MPADPYSGISATPARRALTAATADAAMLAGGWSLLCLVLLHPEAMLALLALPLLLGRRRRAR